MSLRHRGRPPDGEGALSLLRELLQDAGREHADPGIPFVGILAQTFDCNPGGANAVFGAPLGRMLGKFALGTPPEDSTKALGSILFWRSSGRRWPHPFFDRATRESNRPLTILSDAEREVLRPQCGPKAA